MGFTNFEFPHTRTWDSDLREIIDLYKELKAITDNIDSFIKSHLEAYIIEWEKRFAELESEISKQQADFSVEVYKHLEEQLATVKSELQKQLTMIRTDFDKYKADVNTNIGEMQSTITTFQAYVNSQLSNLRTYIDAQNELQELHWKDVVNEMYEYIENLRLEMPEIVNPINGRITTIEQALDDVFGALRFNALTASEYDSLEITAQEYDAKELSTTDYDYNGKTILK